ncbi:50S ribosomal protein L11 methyltransferase [Candidatus Kuenenbacteria bacterium]|nr:50S ribosomal protein L11 methyltransferase [Candidatus Kuenenbacteria bacterium]
MKYSFILGHNPTLSIMEILNVFLLFKINVQIISFSEEALLLEIENEFSIKTFFSRLGGSIKMGEIEKDYKDYTDIDKLDINEILKLFNIQEDKKVYFGLSFYNLNAPAFFKIQEGVKKLAIKIKRKLQEQGLKVRWVISQEKNLSSVVVKKNKLIEQGAEILILIDKDKVYLGKTLMVQEFEKYNQRDYNRPVRDIEKGMLPPKLAQIMLNLGQIKKEQIILDPFCGSGTILQEASLMGYENVIGSDIDFNSIKTTKKNLEWLHNKIKNQKLVPSEVEGSKIKNKLFQCDARELSKKIPFNSIDTIVSEPYLGPIKDIKNTTKIIRELSKLYLESFREFKKILKTQGVIVIIFPVFKTVKNELLFLSILDEIKKQGWKNNLKLPRELFQKYIIKITLRNSIIYSRPDQRVFREIFIFRKTERKN